MVYYSAKFDEARFDFSFFDTIIYESHPGEPVVSTELVKPKIYNEEVVPKETTILIKPKVSAS